MTSVTQRDLSCTPSEVLGAPSESSSLEWYPFGPHLRADLEDGSSIFCARVMGTLYRAVVLTTSLEVEMLSAVASTLQMCMNRSETYAEFIRDLTDSHWKDYPATQDQIDLMRNLDITSCEGVTMGEAEALLNQHLKVPATMEQVQVLNTEALHPRPDLLTRMEASLLLEYEDDDDQDTFDFERTIAGIIFDEE